MINSVRTRIARNARGCSARWFAAERFVAPPMTYIAGEEMSWYTMKIIREKWVEPFVDTRNWEYFDLSCKARDDTEDKVLHDAVASGAKIGAIFKEPTITPTSDQVQELGLRKAWGSPNGAMRRGWNGITISRDTIHIPGIKLGFERPVFFERHAIGGEYGAGWKSVGKGRVLTTFFPDDMKAQPVIIDGREVNNEENAVVIYDNPLDNVDDLAHIFFKRCLAANIVPYVVTKKTVFKWQEGFWQKMKKVFDANYKQDYLKAGLLDKTGGELQHLISDAATMQIIRWTGGGFGMACHNYDGDMLTDEVAQVHRSPGFITSNLVGKSADGSLIKEFEASHGTVADLWHAHLRGEETSMNPLGMVVALLGAMEHAALLDTSNKAVVDKYVVHCREAVYKAFRDGKGTRDLSGPTGLTTEQFVDHVAADLKHRMETGEPLGDMPAMDMPGSLSNPLAPSRKIRKAYKTVDQDAMKVFFERFDINQDGSICFEEFEDMCLELGIAPVKPQALNNSMKQSIQKGLKESSL
jgi:isocitrate dehydrogenase